MGRRKSDVWIHFKEVKIDGIIRTKCDACADTVDTNTEIMARHWKSCVTANSTDLEIFRVPWGRGGDMVSTSQRVPGGVFAKKVLLGQVYNRYSMQPTYWITDTTVPTWIMLKYSRP